MATFTYLPDWGASPELPQTTRKVAFGDGYEQRSQSGLMPYLPVWSLRFSRRTQAEATAIAAWLEAQQANVVPFDWAPPGSDTTASAEQFGTGDGVTPAFQLTKGGLAVTAGIVVSAITREDWQGVVALSSAARTNLCLQSKTIGTSPWGGFNVSSTNPTVTANAAAAPDGTTTATKLDFPTTGAGATSGLRQTISGLTNPSTLQPSLWVRADSATQISLRKGNGAAGYQVLNVGTTWTRIVPDPGSNAATTFNFDIVQQENNASRSIYVWGAQLEVGSSPTSFISTVAAPVSVTDYTVNASGLVTFGETPVSAAKLRWSGTYTLPYVKWVADKWSPATPDGFNSWSVTATFRRVMG